VSCDFCGLQIGRIGYIKWCSGDYANLKIVEIPDDVNYYISDYDGMEAVEEAHRTWG